MIIDYERSREIMRDSRWFEMNNIIIYGGFFGGYPMIIWHCCRWEGSFWNTHTQWCFPSARNEGNPRRRHHLRALSDSWELFESSTVTDCPWYDEMKVQHSTTMYNFIYIYILWKLLYIYILHECIDIYIYIHLYVGECLALFVCGRQKLFLK